jgi:hypothetical protein
MSAHFYGTFFKKPSCEHEKPFRKKIASKDFEFVEALKEGVVFRGWSLKIN